MITRIMVLLMSLVLIPGLCFAEFYKYRDANGVLRFTDNLADVPKHQRENIQQYQEAIIPEPAEAVEKAPELNLNERADQLNTERDLLAKEYAELAAERNAMEKETPDPQDADAFTAYKNRVDDFNIRIKAYEEKRKTFQIKVDAFNNDAKTP
jgi:hypothetical protein